MTEKTVCTLGIFHAPAFAADFPPAAPEFYQRTHRVRLKNLGTTDKKSSRKIKYKKIPRVHLGIILYDSAVLYKHFHSIAGFTKKIPCRQLCLQAEMVIFSYCCLQDILSMISDLLFFYLISFFDP